MPKPKDPDSRKCPCCNHPERKALDSQIASGVSYKDIAFSFPGLTQRSVEYHGRNHLTMSRQEIVRRAEAIETGAIQVASQVLSPTLVPKGELWDWGRDILIEATSNLRDLTLETRSIRAYDVLLRALELTFKVAAPEQNQPDSELVLRIVHATPEGDVDENGNVVAH